MLHRSIFLCCIYLYDIRCIVKTQQIHAVEPFWQHRTRSHIALSIVFYTLFRLVAIDDQRYFLNAYCDETDTNERILNKEQYKGDLAELLYYGKCKNYKKNCNITNAMHHTWINRWQSEG